MSWISPAVMRLLPASSPQKSSVGRVGFLRAANTPKSTSLGTVLNAPTIRAFGTLWASCSAPEEEWATTSSVLSSFIGREQLTMTFSLESGSKAGAIDHEPVVHVAALHACIGVVDLVRLDELDVRDNAVLPAVVEHLLRLGNPANVGPGEALVAADEHTRVERGGGGRQC